MDWDKLQPVEGFEHLYRDKRNGAIINMDAQIFEDERKRKNIALQKIKKDQSVAEKVEHLEKELSDIKILLTEIAGKIK